MPIPPYNRAGSLTISYNELVDFVGEPIFENLEEWTDYPNLLANKDKIVKAFHIRYDCREIGYDMPFKFINRLELKFMELAPRYELAFDKYKNDTVNITKVGKTTLSELEGLRTLTVSNTSSRDSTSNYYDTPKTSLPNPLDNPSNASVGKDENTTTGSTEDKNSQNGSVSETDGQYLEDLNKLIDAYRSLVVQFVNDLEDLFLQVTIWE